MDQSGPCREQMGPSRASLQRIYEGPVYRVWAGLRQGASQGPAIVGSRYHPEASGQGGALAKMQPILLPWERGRGDRHCALRPLPKPGLQGTGASTLASPPASVPSLSLLGPIKPEAKDPRSLGDSVPVPLPRDQSKSESGGSREMNNHREAKAHTHSSAASPRAAT